MYISAAAVNVQLNDLHNTSHTGCNVTAKEKRYAIAQRRKQTGVFVLRASTQKRKQKVQTKWRHQYK